MNPDATNQEGALASCSCSDIVRRIQFFFCGRLWPAGLSPVCDSILTTGNIYGLVVGVSGEGFFSLWLDRNQNGVFDVTDQLVTDATPFAGVVEATISLSGVSTGDTYLRMRYSSTPGLGPVGEAEDGEVEDCAISINQNQN